MSSAYSLGHSFARTQKDRQISHNGDTASGRPALTPINDALPPKLPDEHKSVTQTSPIDKDSIQHRLFGIRTREPQNGANQGSERSLSPTLIANNQKRPRYIIDLTEDDEDEPAPPRKKSCGSSNNSSDESVKVITRPRQPIIRKQEDKDPQLTADHVKRKEELPPAYENAPAQHSVQHQLSLRSPSSRFSPSQEDIIAQEQSQVSRNQLTQHQHHPRQYASAVVVHSSPQPAEFTPDELQQRQEFLRNVAVVRKVTLSNSIDNSSPPTNFRFVNESELKQGVNRAPVDVMVGCECRRKRGKNECRYPNECSCLRDSNGESLIKRSQYSDGNAKKGCLMKQVLQNRWNIFECNPRCDCSYNCKNRVVQWGPKVGFDIFKTKERGWGLRCDQDLLEGQFVDTYRGEIITTEEADERKKGANEDNYLLDFDKFEEAKYVCDGMYMGGPTRFMNHSCEPNCALFTVSYNHYDPHIYELAFFAKEAIPKGTELTFDYLDQDDEVEGGRITDEDAKEMEKEKGYAPSVCRCGAKKCRGYFFFSK